MVTTLTLYTGMSSISEYKSCPFCKKKKKKLIFHLALQVDAGTLHSHLKCMDMLEVMSDNNSHTSKNNFVTVPNKEVHKSKRQADISVC